LKNAYKPALQDITSLMVADGILNNKAREQRNSHALMPKTG